VIWDALVIYSDTGRLKPTTKELKGLGKGFRILNKSKMNKITAAYFPNHDGDFTLTLNGQMVGIALTENIAKAFCDRFNYLENAKLSVNIPNIIYSGSELIKADLKALQDESEQEEDENHDWVKNIKL
jgi:hypothetical protein